jgi:hypothetical protein
MNTEMSNDLGSHTSPRSSAHARKPGLENGGGRLARGSGLHQGRQCSKGAWLSERGPLGRHEGAAALKKGVARNSASFEFPRAIGQSADPRAISAPPHCFWEGLARDRRVKRLNPQ